jgi:hypothetical protein
MENGSFSLLFSRRRFVGAAAATVAAGTLGTVGAGNRGAPIAALGDVVRVPEALHELRPDSRYVVGVPTGARRLAGEAVAGDGGDHEVERVPCRGHADPTGLGRDTLTASVGCVTCAAPFAVSAEDLMEAVDRQLNAAKETRRNRVCSITLLIL